MGAPPKHCKRCLAPHDVLIEAVNLVLQRYGRPTVAELADNA